MSWALKLQNVVKYTIINRCSHGMGIALMFYGLVCTRVVVLCKNENPLFKNRQLIHWGLAHVICRSCLPTPAHIPRACKWKSFNGFNKWWTKSAPSRCATCSYFNESETSLSQHTLLWWRWKMLTSEISSMSHVSLM